MKSKILLSILFVLFTAVSFYSQEENDSTKEKSHRSKWWNWENWTDHDWTKWDFKGRPFIEVNYGFGKYNHKKLVSKFADFGMAELKLGYASQYSFYEENLVEFKEKYAFISKLSADLKNSDAKIGEMKSNLWRFGFANRKGFAYKFNHLTILPYYGEGYIWSRIDMLDYPAKFYLLTNPPMTLAEASDDTDILNRYHQEFRFGTINEGGIRLDIANTFSFNVGYEAAVIFPRHMFWKHLGSMVIEEAAHGLLNNFLDEIADVSPYATPIVNFILKNGLSYAFFTLKKDRMNWPFETETPLTLETFKLGFTFTF